MLVPIFTDPTSFMIGWFLQELTKFFNVSIVHVVIAFHVFLTKEFCESNLCTRLHIFICNSCRPISKYVLKQLTRIAFCPWTAHCSILESKKNESYVTSFALPDIPPILCEDIPSRTPHSNEPILRGMAKKSYGSQSSTSAQCRKTISSHGTSAANKSTPTIRGQSMKLKTPLKQSKKSGVVYKINRKNCAANCTRGIR